jgi:AmmeMemoRadiSam system protein B
MTSSSVAGGAAVRRPAVAGAFYPADPERLRALVRRQLVAAEVRYPRPATAAWAGAGLPLGLLVPHAGLEYSGVVAAAAWRWLAAGAGGGPLSVVILGTNHRAGWLAGIGAWDRGSWQTPLGSVAVDEALAGTISELGAPFLVDLDAHRAEHSIEVQLPFVQEVVPDVAIVPLAVSTGVGSAAIQAGARLGTLLATRAREATRRLVLAISSDMAHYPSAADAEAVTAELLPALEGLDPEALATRERALRRRGIPDLACGMCGIEPSVVGLAALRAAGATRGTALAAATSADAGGPRNQTVGYLALRFD